MLEKVAGARSAIPHSRWALRSARVLRGAGLVQPTHPLATFRRARDIGRWGPLAGVARLGARRWPGAIGLVDDRGALTFGELDRRSNALAWAWRGQGIRQDSAIGVLCRNHRGLVEATFAAAKLGAQVVALRTEFGAEQLAGVVQREGVTTIVYDDEFSPAVAALPDHVSRYLAHVDGPAVTSATTSVVTSTVTSAITLDELIAAAPARELPLPAEPGGLTFLAGHRDGYRGVPCRIRPGRFAAQFLDRIPMPAGEAVLVAIPLVRACGLVPTLIALAVGSTVVLHRDGQPQQLCASIVRYRCAGAVLTPRQLPALLDPAGPTPSTLRVLVSSGGVLPVELGNRATQVFGDVVHNWYAPPGSLLAAVATPADWRAVPGTVGRAPFGAQLSVLGPDGRRIVEPGRPGAVHVGNRFAASQGGAVPTGASGQIDRTGRLFLDDRGERG
ncbi:MAG TPA: AMP-binding protein [Jatrophihabitantaceae bacterium]